MLYASLAALHASEVEHVFLTSDDEGMKRVARHHGIRTIDRAVALLDAGAKAVIVSSALFRDGQVDVDFAKRLAERVGRDRVIAAVKTLGETWAKDGIRPEQVAAVISRAIRDPKPRTRYLAGRDAALLARLVNFIPDRLLDRMLGRQMGLNSR